MDQGALQERQERVEVELTADHRGRRRSRAQAAEQSVTVDSPRLLDPGVSDGDATTDASGVYTPPAGDPPGLSSERRRLIATAATVGVVALVLGWFVGRTGDGDSAIQGGDTTQPSTVTTTPSTQPTDTAPAVQPSDLPTTTRAPRVTTTTVAGWVESTIEINPVIAELGLDLVIVDQAGNLSEVDLATGEVAKIDLNEQIDWGTPLFAGVDWTLYTSNTTGRSWLFQGHSEPESVSVGDPWQLRWVEGTDRFWASTSTGGTSMTAREILYDGTPTGNEIELDQNWWLLGVDPAGGLLVNLYGMGVYRVDAAGSSRVSDGNLLATSADTAVVSECGDAIDSCGVYLIDRATGVRRRLSVTVNGEERGLFDSVTNYGYTTVPRLSPDGRYAPVMSSGNTSSLGVIDLESGEFVSFGGYPESAVWWSPDSRYLLYLMSSTLWAFDVVDRQRIRVSDSGLSVMTFTVRPTLG